MLNFVAKLIHTSKYTTYFHLDFNLANLFPEINGRLAAKRNANFKMIFLNRFVYVFDSTK